MRISDCAKLTGTTVRTIRHYHHVGLLPVPGRTGSRREYELIHVARVLRIRWLAEAGLSLDSIGTLLAEEQRTPGPLGPDAESLHDLRATARSIEERISELRAQRDRISALIGMAESGRGLRALPAGIELFYDRLVRAVSDPEALEVLRREQRLAELFAQRGLVPPRLGTLVKQLTDEDVALIVEFYTRFAHIAELDESAIEQEYEELTALMLDWTRQHRELAEELVRALPAWTRRRAALKPLMAFTVLLTSDARQREALHRLSPIVMELIEAAADSPAAADASQAAEFPDEEPI